MTIWAHTKSGMRQSVMPGARMLRAVTRKLMEPKSEEVMMNTMASSQTVWPGLITERGG